MRRVCNSDWVVCGRLINLTDHRVDVLAGEPIEIPPSGTVARVEAVSEQAGSIDGVPVVRTLFGAPVGLPETRAGTIYLTSTLVAQAAAAAGRSDVVAPDTGPSSAIRDAQGRIVGVRRLQTFSPSLQAAG